MGTLVKAGGKTVKDVAGYDMKKLYIGSWGTLGAITQATFRLLPLPEARATVAMAFPQLATACAAVAAIRASFMIPSTAELLSAGAMGPEAGEMKLASGEYLLLVQAEGALEDVERMKRELTEVAARHGASSSVILEGDAETGIWKARKEVFAQMPLDRPAVLVKGSVPLKHVVDFAGAVEAFKKDSVDADFAAHAGNGVVYAFVSAGTGEDSKLVSAVQNLQRVAGEFGGFALLQRGPGEVSSKVQIWPPRTDYGVMRQIKAQLDPAGLWNVARTPGGRG
jgi:glycolate oxidase